MAWVSNATFRSYITDRYGPPVEAEKNGLHSIFKEKFSEDQNTLKPGQKISDQKMWEEVCLYCPIPIPISISISIINDAVIGL
jgi:hypothetical protein